MKRRDFLHSSLLAAAATTAGIRSAYAVVATGDVPLWRRSLATVAKSRCAAPRSANWPRIAWPVLLAGDAGYDTARLIRNPSFDKRPALIVQPRTCADVQAAVLRARAPCSLR